MPSTLEKSLILLKDSVIHLGEIVASEILKSSSKGQASHSAMRPLGFRRTGLLRCDQSLEEITPCSESAHCRYLQGCSVEQCRRAEKPLVASGQTTRAPITQKLTRRGVNRKESWLPTLGQLPSRDCQDQGNKRESSKQSRKARKTTEQHPRYNREKPLTALPFHTDSISEHKKTT